MKYYRRGRIDWFDVLFFSALALILAFGLFAGFKSAQQKRQCEARGGVWITDTGCVQIVDGKLQKV